MSTTIDERVVEMRFDNKQFENNVQTTLSTVDKLKQSLNFKGVSKGFDNINTAVKNVSMAGINTAVETVHAKFSALEVMAVTALANITNSAVNAGKRIVSALTVDPIKSGFSEYETQINAVQTILANTESKGKTLEDVNGALDELNAYADKTIYNFTEMTRNIGTFTAAGVDLDTSVSAIKGIANLAAVSGSTSQQASTAMYQLSQALASGTVKLMDWNSVVNAGMGGQVFQDALKETARVHGVAIDDMIKANGSFRETLSNGWLTSEILTETLSKFTGDLNEEQLKTMGYTEEQIASIIKMGQTANDAATKVKTFTQLFDTLKEAAQSGWTQSWEIVVGDFEEAKVLLTEASNIFGDIINSSAQVRNEMLSGWKDLGGRTALIDAVRNAFEGIASVVTPIKEAFREIFPPMTAQQLFNITEGLKNLTEKLKLSDTQSENLKRTFKGLFAILDIGKQAISAVWNAIKPLIGGAGTLVDAVLETTASWGDWLVNLNETIKSTNVFNEVLQTVSSFIKTTFSKIGEFASSAVEKIKEFVEAVNEKFKIPGFELIHSFLERVHNRLTNFGETADSVAGTATTAFDAFSESLAGSKIIQILTAIWEGTKTIVGGIANAFGKLTEGLTEGMAEADFGTIFDVISGVSLGGIALAIANFLKTISEPIGGFTDILDSVKGSLEAIQTNIKAGTLLKIAGAVALLAGAIVVISLIDSAKLAASLGAITGLFAELMASMAVFNKIGAIKGATRTAVVMIALSASVAILAGAMKSLSELSWNEVAKGLTAVLGLTATLAGAMKLMSSGKGKMMKGAVGLIAVAAAVKILASACKDISALSWEEIGKGLAGVSGILLGMGVFTKLAGDAKRMVSIGLGMVLIGASMKIFASAMSDIGELEWEEIGKGLAAMAGVLTEVAIAVNFMPKNMVSTGTGLVIIAASMKIFASALSDFGSMSWEEIGKGLTAMAGALTEITIAVNFMPKNMIGIGTGLVVVGAALLIISDAIKNMGGMSWEEIGKGLATMGGALAILAVGLNVMNGTLAGSAALLVASAALAVLAPSLSLLGAMSWEAIGKGLVALAGAFTVLGVAGLLLGPIVPAILGLSASLALIGVSVLAVGAGLAALAAGFVALGTLGAAGATGVVAALTVIVVGVVGLIPVVIAKLGEGIIEFCKVLIQAAPKICEALVVIITAAVAALVETIPLVVDGVFTLLESVLTTLLEYTPTLVETAFGILIAILEGIANGISNVVQTAIDIVLGFLDGIAQKLPDVIQAGFDLLLSLINGITDAIETNTPLLVDAMKRLFLTLIDAAITVITGALDGIIQAGKKIVNALVEGIKSLFGKVKRTVTQLMGQAKEKITEKVSEWLAAGKDLISGFINGIKEKASGVVEAAKGVVSDALAAAKNLLGIKSPSREFAKIGRYSDEGLIMGLQKYAGGVATAAEDVGKSALDAMSNAIANVADIINGDIDSEPTIRPVLDLSNVETGARTIGALFSRTQAVEIGTSMNNRHNSNVYDDEDIAPTRGNTYSFTQNNYSPKALSRVDIYRQTKNQFSAMERMMEHG